MPVTVNEMLTAHWMAFTDILNVGGGLLMLTDADKEREFRRRRGAKIEKAMINLSWTRAQLAAKSGRDIRVIRDLINGEATVQPQSIRDICQALKIEPELYPPIPTIEVADLKYGAYARDPYKHYEGAYFAFRRSFSVPGVLVRSIFEIKWDDELRSLAFREALPNQVNTTQTIDGGEIYISQNTDLIHLVTGSKDRFAR
jgi:transcriptional regulator with XRE-family HTH domain